MKLQPDKSSAPLVRAHSSLWLQIDDQRFSQSMLISSLDGMAPCVWEPTSFAQIQASHLQSLAQCGAELVILGTGKYLKFPPPSWLAPFAQARIGLETMDTAAACRTYNILASEGRKVLAALLLETDTETTAPNAHAADVSR